MLEMASLTLRLDNVNRHNDILIKCLDVKEELLNFYREENEIMKNRIGFLEETKR
jgi:hypothetical protein